MKIRTLLVFFCLISFSMMAQDSASVILNNACKIAAKENKNVFVIFHASWCGWCKKMDQNMNSENCKSLFDRNYVIEHLTVMESKENKHLENPGAFDLMTQYRGGDSGIPFFLIFDKKGKLLADSFDGSGQNLGCPASKEEVEEFIKMLKKTSNLNEKELEIVFNQFLIKK